MNDDFINTLFQEHQKAACCPPPKQVIDWHKQMVGLLFAEFSQISFEHPSELEAYIDKLKDNLIALLHKAKISDGIDINALANAFFTHLPQIRSSVVQDVEAMYQGDPAAESLMEVIRTYPGFYAIISYRLAHQLYKLGIKLIPRIITEHAHSKTGIDIHPAAQIGNHFCIDHGTGIVIGATTQIGNHVKIYQGVTLGALSVDKKDASTKRHPTIEDHVVIYAGASILGGNTVIGHHSVVGGNVWLTKSVPAFSKIYYKASMSDQAGETDLIIMKTEA